MNNKIYLQNSKLRLYILPSAVEARHKAMKACKQLRYGLEREST
jgi:hypothetical protein